MANVPHTMQKCDQCGKIGHWKIKCKSLKSDNRTTAKDSQHGNDPLPKAKTVNVAVTRSKKTINAVEVDPNDTFEQFSFHAIHKDNENNCDEKDIIVNINAVIPGYKQIAKMKCKIDTGVQGNVLPMRTFNIWYMVRSYKSVHM